MIIKIETRAQNNETVAGTVTVTALGETTWANWSASNSPADQNIKRETHDIVIYGEWRLPLNETVVSELVAAYLNTVGSTPAYL
jgi:hypothetical protein